jgi:ABC-type multidrug transport system fused ATPase/permease subunit
MSFLVLGSILSQVRYNGSMVSNFFDNWALTVSALVWANLAGILVQVDIPAEVWGQYPLILVGVVLVVALARYWVANEKEWRAFVVERQAAQQTDQLRVLQLVQTNNEQLVALIEKNHKEQLELQREGQREVFDAALERILGTLADYDRNMGKRKND